MNATYWAPHLVLPISPERDHLIGPADAPVSLLEYGDYQCPFCGAAHPVVKALVQRMGDSLCYVFRHFPVTTVHPDAELAAEAAEAAAGQGRFWQMHDRLFTHQQDLGLPALERHAGAIGLDVARFEREVSSHMHHDRVREDFMSGVRSGVNGTPSFFINGERYDGSWDLESLAAALVRAAAVRL
jgi:protein-disulfide isomerase